MIRDDSDQWRSLTALMGHDRLKENLGLVSNRIADTEVPREMRLAVRESLLGLLSEQSSLSHPQMGEVWRSICESCDLGVSTLLTLAASGLPGRRRRLRRMLGERVVRITVKPFMDMSTMIEERLTQCCVHVGTRSDQDQCAPFCAVQAWNPLGATAAVGHRQVRLAGPAPAGGDRLTISADSRPARAALRATRDGVGDEGLVDGVAVVTMR